MRSKPVEALECVAEDLAVAAAHYQSWRDDGTDHILGKYDETVSWIAWNPDMFPRKFGNIQRAILKQSYYVVYQEKDRTLVLAVLDGRRKPSAIRQLVSSRKPTRQVYRGCLESVAIRYPPFTF